MPARATGCGSDAGTGTGRGTGTERGTVLCPVASRHYGAHAGMDDGRNGCLADCRPRGRRHKSSLRRTITLGTPILRPADYTDGHPGRTWTVELPGCPLSSSTSFSTCSSTFPSFSSSSTSSSFSTISSTTFSSSSEPCPLHQQLLQTDSIRFGSKDADCYPDSAQDVRLVLRGSLLARIGQPPPPHTTGHLPGARLLGSALPVLPQCADRARSHLCAAPLCRRTFSSRRRSQNHSTHAAFRLRHQIGPVLHTDDGQEGVRCEPTDNGCVKCEPTDNGCVKCEPKFVRCEPTDNGCVRCKSELARCEPAFVQCEATDNGCVRCEPTDNECVKYVPKFVRCEPTDNGCVRCKSALARCEPAFVQCEPSHVRTKFSDNRNVWSKSSDNRLVQCEQKLYKLCNKYVQCDGCKCKTVGECCESVRCEPAHKLFRCGSTLVRCKPTLVRCEPTHKLCFKHVQCESTFVWHESPIHKLCSKLVQCEPPLVKLQPASSQREPAFLRRSQTPEDSSKTLVSSRPSVDRFLGPGILAHSPHHSATTERPVSIAHASVKTRCKPVEILVKCSSTWGLGLASVTTNVPQGLSLFMLRVEILFVNYLILAIISQLSPHYLC